ncbi:MAG TPA: hypothetical protein PKI10_11275, partial [Syntrophorhabdus sp.]|nr:hypothetical protein [Syntrophorhabdus sp.]
NLPFLFTYKKYPDLNIPNTTNSLDGCFAYLKELVRVRRGSTRKMYSTKLHCLICPRNKLHSYFVQERYGLVIAWPALSYKNHRLDTLFV